MRRGHAAVTTESFVAQSCKVRGNAGVRPRGIANRNRGTLGNPQVSGFTGMYRAGVIPAWCGCRPGVDVLAADADGHRVLGVDRLHILPTDSVVGHRVPDLDAVVEDAHARSNEQQVDAVSKATAEHHVSSDALTTCVDTVSPQQATEQQPRQTGIGKTARRSEHIWLVHPIIIAHGEGACRND